MKNGLRKALLISPLLLGLLLDSGTGFAQSSCCAESKKDQSENVKEKDESKCEPSYQATSGCTPSACRGAKTKFGEAKVISDLRLSLINLKADLENSTDPEFEERSFDIHDIVGESDDESLEIIVNEIKLIEDDFTSKLDYKPSEFALPENKARQVTYLGARIEGLKTALLEF